VIDNRPSGGASHMHGARRQGSAGTVARGEGAAALRAAWLHLKQGASRSRESDELLADEAEAASPIALLALDAVLASLKPSPRGFHLLRGLVEP